MADLFSFGYDLLQNFFSVCKSFLLASFMNENKIFSFKKKKKEFIFLCLFFYFFFIF
jgi:hypothetical protein